MIEQWRGVLHFLAGLENGREDGEGVNFNFIMSNGDRSTQKIIMWSTTNT